MSETVLAVRMSDPLLGEVSGQAARAGVSLEEWLVSIAEERVRDEQVMERFFSQANQDSAGQTMLEILDSSNDGPPLQGDEMPTGFVINSKRS